MARMNPRRRRLASQTKLFREIVSAHGKAHDDSCKLQRGPVQSCLTKTARGIAIKDQIRVSAPRGITLAPSRVFDGAKWSDQSNKGVLGPRKPKKGEFVL